MKVEVTELTAELVQVSLVGRLDIEGAGAASDQLGFLTTGKQAKVIVDLSQVNFLASIGIRLLMTSARTQQARGGKLVLAAPQPLVKKVIEIAGIDQLIPLFESIAAAQLALGNS